MEHTRSVYNGAHEVFFENEVPAEHIIRWNVPGSFELVYGCKKMLQTQNVDAVIAKVVLFKAKHFDFVCIHNNIDTTTNATTTDRSGGIHGNKGTEAAAIKNFIRQRF
jgi:6,7-dimethyl-8-ribityllumazine synthase